MALTSIKQILADADLASPGEFKEWTKEWRTAAENGSEEPLLGFFAREKGLTEETFLERLAKAMELRFVEPAELNPSNEARMRASLEGFNSAGSTNRNSIALARRSRNVSSVSPFSRAKKPSNGSSEPFSAAVRHSFVHSLNSPGEAKSASAKICFIDVSAIPRVADEEG